MERIKIKITRVGKGRDLPLPRYMTEHSAGMDLYAAIEDDIFLNPGERTLIPSGIAISIPPGFEAQIRPRSGLAIKNGIGLLNAPGTIDADYRGEIGVVLINLGKDLFRITKGDRIAQMVINKVYHASFELADKLEPTPRGSGGFGHTG